jgi:outer membrane lipoprotein carrier protein
MKIKVFFLLVLLFNLELSAQEQKMSAQEIVKFKEAIENQSKSIKSIKTDFVQLKHMDFLTKDIETSGKMFFKSPNMLNWQYYF